MVFNLVRGALLIVLVLKEQNAKCPALQRTVPPQMHAVNTLMVKRQGHVLMCHGEPHCSISLHKHFMTLGAKKRACRPREIAGQG